MSFPDHSTSNNEDPFSSNIPDYVSTIPDYFPTSSGKTYSNASNSTSKIPSEFSPSYSMKDIQAFYAKELPIPPQDPITPLVILTPSLEFMDEDQAGPDPGESRGALAGPDLEPTHDEFMVDLYLKVQERLKFSANEHVFVEDPISSTGTLSSMKNLKDAFIIRDQFIKDKSTEDEPEKPNVEAEVVSMVTVPIYQASFLVPSLSMPIPVIDLSPPKPASFTTQAPVFMATTATTTTPLPPPPQQQSSTESELAERFASLKKKLSTLEQTNKNLDSTTWNLGYRVYTLKLRDLPNKIDKAV
uniref:Reverse transcriptase domain-containing protein n=1 Tax=Tanacetum cinerariifolium TaxID=118510 RepID=A0A6L2M163_TANCI|nr:hypothetical protein [Tanacetum cinerariifolium]